MNGVRLTAAADRAGQRYNLLLSSVGGVFSHHASMQDPGSEAVRASAIAEAYNLAEAYLVEERFQIEAAIEQERTDAVVVTSGTLDVTVEEPSEDTQHHTDLIAAELEHALRLQLERDIASMTKALRDIALRASLMGRARGITRQNALASLRAGNAVTPPQFVFMDRGGKRWPSEKLVRAIWRHALVLVWNETALSVMSTYGVDMAVIDHPDGSHAENGTLISLAESTSEVTWDQVRDDVFHPNSHAWLSPYIE